MSVLIETYQNVKPIGRDNDGPELTHTRWGYMITSQDAGGIATRAGYLVVRYIGIVMALVAIGLLIAPGTTVHPEVLPLKLGVSALFFIVGAVAVWAAGTIAVMRCRWIWNDRNSAVAFAAPMDVSYHWSNFLCGMQANCS